jgi:DNA helicase-4
MGFAGSNLDFFINFDKYFPHPARTDLTKNYRSIKSIVEAGAHVIKNNKDSQIKKKTISNSNKSNPIQVYSSLHQKKFYMKYYEQIAKHCLNRIKEYHEDQKYPYDEFLVLMRITSENKPIWKFIDQYAEELKIPIIKESHISRPGHVRFMSIHKSKGLQAKVVFILNVDKGLYGFPCELETLDIFLPAIKDNDGFREQEERRLFYVALTRAKEEVVMYTQKCSESNFITEIKDFTKREDLSY